MSFRASLSARSRAEIAFRRVHFDGQGLRQGVVLRQCSREQEFPPAVVRRPQGTMGRRHAWCERDQTSRPVRPALSLACDLDQVPACVIEHGGADRLHLQWLLRELHPQSAQPLVFRLHVIDGKRRVGDAIIDERVLERPRRGVPIRLEHQLGAVRLLGETTVSQRASPSGTSVFFTNPRTSV
jgi:hypothetical protein